MAPRGEREHNEGAPLPLPLPLPRIDAGTAIGPYIIDRRWTKGAGSVHYLAHDADGEAVVLKVVAPEVAAAPARARLIREARTLAAIGHPAVVRVRGAGEHEGAPWIAMDRVDGTDLKRLLADCGPIAPEIASRYAIQLTEGLAAAHEAGVVHRDLKPSSIVLTSEGQLVIVDFGIVRRRSECRDGAEGEWSGSDAGGATAYQSPEQLELGLADERSDVWALGCILFELVVGAPPFGKAGAPTVAAILGEEPFFPAHVPGSLRHVLTGCLQKNSFARIASARELLTLLREAGPLLGEPETTAPERPSTRPSSVRPSVGPSLRAPPSASSRGASLRVSASSRPPPLAPTRTSTSPPSSGSWVAASRGRTKGTAVRAVVAWFTETYGDSAVEQIAKLASPELNACIRFGDPLCGVMASAWYDTPLIGELLDLLERVARPVDSADFSSCIGAAIARDNVGGVYRALFRLIASPTILAANAHRVWQTYVDEGSLTVHLRGESFFEARIRGWSGHHPTVCRTVRPTIEHVLRTVGYQAPSVSRTGCVGEGDGACAFEASWG
ncbi:MAG: protein kinase [Polyangiaceae bacterium]